MPNGIWGLDLTGKADSTGHCYPILALVDHGTRANLRLIALLDKRSATVLKVFIKTIVRFGYPKFT